MSDINDRDVRGSMIRGLGARAVERGLGLPSREDSTNAVGRALERGDMPRLEMRPGYSPTSRIQRRGRRVRRG